MGDPVGFTNTQNQAQIDWYRAAALNQVYNERPLAFAQILLAIFACEALGAFQQAKPGAEPGNLGWDPLNLRADNPELWEKTQLRESSGGKGENSIPHINLSP